MHLQFNIALCGQYSLEQCEVIIPAFTSSLAASLVSMAVSLAENRRASALTLSQSE